MLVTATAKLRYVSIPPRKMRLVAGMVKGMRVQKALNVLNFTPKIAAKHVALTVKSAAANALSAEGTDVIRPEDLIVKNVWVDAAPTAKRIRFRSMGRVFRYRKRFCHLTVLLEGESEAVEATASKTKTPTRAKKEDTPETKVAEKTAKVEKTSAGPKAAKEKPAKANDGAKEVEE